MAITVAATAEALKRYQIQYAPQLAQKLRQGLEWENPDIMKGKQADDSYVSPTITINDVIQPFQCDFTPNVNFTFDQVETRLQQMKVDIQFTCDDLNKFYHSWMSEWVEWGKSLTEWSFPRYLWETVVIPKIIEELNFLYWKGVRVEPTPGTAGALVTSMDGLETKIAGWISGGKLVPIAVGAITGSNIVEKVELFCDSLPAVYKSKPGAVLMSDFNQTRYVRDYRARFGTGNGVDGNENLGAIIDNTNKKVVGNSSMNGSDIFIFCPDMFYMRKIGQGPLPVIRWQEFDRKLKGLAEFDRAVGIEHYFNCFVSDQLVPSEPEEEEEG